MSHSNAQLPENAKEYWTHPSAKEKGDATSDVIYCAIGRASTVWEGLEYVFVSLFCHFVEGVPSNAAARAYGAISSSKGRMEALENAAEVYFHLHQVSKELTDEFWLVRKHFDMGRGRRNDIVHAVTMEFQFEGDSAGIFLVPAMYGSHKNFAFKPPDGDRFSMALIKYRLTSEDIIQFTIKFDHLRKAVLHFHSDFVHAHPHPE